MWKWFWVSFLKYALTTQLKWGQNSIVMHSSPGMQAKNRKKIPVNFSKFSQGTLYIGWGIFDLHLTVGLFCSLFDFQKTKLLQITTMVCADWLLCQSPIQFPP
jgi:hypothetical protein